MKNVLLVFLCLFTMGILIRLATYTPPIEYSKPTPVCVEPSPSVILPVINDARAKHGVKPVTSYGYLDQLSKGRALELDGVMDDHEGYINLADNGAFDIRYSSSGENLASGFCNDVPDIIEAWLNSPLHREVMLSPKYDEIGIGVYKNVIVTIYGDID